MLVALGLASWWITRQIDPELLRARVQVALASVLERPVTIDRVFVRPWLARAGFEGVRIAAGPTWESGTLLQLGRAEASIGIASLWRRELVLSSIALRDVDLRYTSGETAEPFRLPEQIPDRIQIGPVTALIRVVEVERARLHVSQPGARRTVEVRGLAARVRPREGGVDVSASADGLALTVPLGEPPVPRTIVVDAPRAEARLRGHTLAVEELEGRWKGERLAVAGEVRDVDATPALALAVRGRLLLGSVAELLGTAGRIEGLATVDLAVKGAAPGPAVTGTVKVAGLVAGPLRARSAAASVAWDGGRVRATDVVAEALGGEIRGSGELAVTQPAAVRVSARFSGIALPELQSLLATPYGLAGHVSGEAELRGDPQRIAHGEGRVRVESADLVLPAALGKLGPAAVEAEGRLASGGLDLTRASVRWTAARVESASGRLTAAGPRGLRAVVVADAGRLGRLLGEDRVAGEARVTAELGGPWRDLTADGRAQAATLVVSGVRLDGVDVPFRLTGRTLTLARTRAALGQSRLEAKGTLSVPPGTELSALRQALRFDLDLAAPSARLEDLDALVPPQWQGRGRFTLTARLAGTLAAWRGEGRFEGAGLSLRGQSVDRLRTRFVVDQQGLEVTGLQGQIDGVPLDGDGALRWDGSGSATAALGPVARYGVSLGRGRLAIDVKDRRLRATVAFPDAEVTATASGRLAEGESVAARVGFRDLDLGGLLSRAAEGAIAAPLELRASGEAEVAIPLARPESARGTLRLDAVRARVSGEEWRNAGAVLARREGGVTTVERLRLESRLGALSATGTVDDHLALDLAVRGDLPLAVLASLRPEVSEASGVLTADLRLRGPARAPQAAGEATLRDGRVTLRQYPRLPLTGISARLSLAGQRLRVKDAVALVAGGELHASGDVGLQWPAPALDLRVRGRVPLAVAASLRPEIREASGTVAVDGHVTGTASAPEATAEATITDGRLILRDYADPITGVRARLALSGRRLRVMEAVASATGAELRLGGEVSLTGASPRLDLTLQGRLPLGVVAALRPEVREAAGLVAVDGRITGTVADPQATGEGTVRDARLTLRDYPDSIRDITARFTVSSQAIRLVSFAGSLGGGELRGTGDLALSGRRPGAYRFAVEARRVALETIEGFQSVWDADLELVGLAARGQLRGQVRLVRGTYVNEEPVLRLLLARRAGGGAGAAGGGLPLQLRVELADGLVVRTSVTRFRAGGSLTVQGTTAAPVLFGTVIARDGSLVFRGERFTLQSASARFVDPRRIDPVVDVRAFARIRSHDVTLRVTGRSEDLEIHASSSPPLPEQDVLSLVAFGQTRAGLGRSGGGAFAGEVAGLIIQDLFGMRGADGRLVDVLEFDTTDTEASADPARRIDQAARGETGGRSLKVGKKLTEQALVLYSQGIEKPDERKLRIEYQVTGPLVIAGEQDFRGGFGGDVLLRLRFR